MATILLTDEEYNDIQTLMQAATNKIASASPRAATHYAQLAKLHADFLAKEDGKRAAKTKKTSNLASIEQQKQARRAAQLSAAQQRVQQQQQGQPAAAQTAQGGGRRSA